MQFELLKEEDLEEVILLCDEVFNEHTDLAYAKKVFEQTKNDPNQIYLVGKLNGKIVSHLKATIIPTIYEDMNTYAILNHVCVQESCRRHNIATKMLDEVSRICKEKGCKNLALWSKNFRIPAHACYQKYGFEVVDAKFFEKML